MLLQLSEIDLKNKTLFHTQLIMAVFQSVIQLNFRLNLRLSSPAPYIVKDETLSV